MFCYNFKGFLLWNSIANIDVCIEELLLYYMKGLDFKNV